MKELTSHAWISGFAVRLMQLRPGLHAGPAIHLAVQSHEVAHGMQPHLAAEKFATHRVDAIDRIITSSTAHVGLPSRQQANANTRRGEVTLHFYNSALGPVECRTDPMSDGRFAAIVILTHPILGLRHQCLGSDAHPTDAVAKARAWAERNFPPRPSGAARCDVA